MFRRIFSISKNTFTETIRQPVFGIILFLSAVLIAFSPAFTMFTLMNSVKFLTDAGLATIAMSGLLLAAFSASSVVSQEIEDKTVLTVICKPVKRFEFILGKYFGIAGAITVAIFLLSMILVFTVRIGVRERALQKLNNIVIYAEILGLLISILLAAFASYFYDRPFFASMILSAVPIAAIIFVVTGFLNMELQPQPFLADLNPQVLWCALLILLAVILMSAIAIASSTRLKVVINVTVCVGIFFLGLISDYVFGRFAAQAAFAKGQTIYESLGITAAKVAYAVVPNIQIFWKADVLATDKVIPVNHVLAVVGYWALYQVAVICIAMFLFQEREIS